MGSGLRRIGLWASVAALAAVAGLAQAAPKIDKARGAVTALSESEITIQADGKSQTFPLSPSWSVILSEPITIDQIQPGMYLGTTNIAKGDGAGTSTEIHASPPGQGGQGVDFVMDAASNTVMTNGVVTVVSNEGGRALTVNHGKGARRVAVPDGIPIVMNKAGDRSMVKVGQVVSFASFTPEAGGGEPRQYITVGPNGTPPLR